MNGPLITIYTQAYNSQKYIEPCIVSVLQQTYSNFEYFICNHGSTDDTQSIIDKYVKMDRRIKSMNMLNEARGFYPDLICEEAKGKYFTMLDSDDMWVSNYLEKLLEYSEENDLDMTVCGIAELNQSTNEIIPSRKPEETYFFTIEENDKYFAKIYNFLRTAWGKLIRMDKLRLADFTVYKKNAVTMIADDTAFTLAIYPHCQRIGVVKDMLLIWRVHGESITATYKESMNSNHMNIYHLAQSVLESIGDKSPDNRDYNAWVYLNALRDILNLLLLSDRDCSFKVHAIAEILNNRLLDEIKEMGFNYSGMIENALGYVVDCAERKMLNSDSDEDLRSILTIMKRLEIF